MESKLVARGEGKDRQTLHGPGAAAQPRRAGHDLHREWKLWQCKVSHKSTTGTANPAINEDLAPRLRESLHEEDNGHNGRRTLLTRWLLEEQKGRGILMTTTLKVLAPGRQEAAETVDFTSTRWLQNMHPTHILLRGMATKQGLTP